MFMYLYNYSVIYCLQWDQYENVKKYVLKKEKIKTQLAD